MDESKVKMYAAIKLALSAFIIISIIGATLLITITTTNENIGLTLLVTLLTATISLIVYTLLIPSIFKAYLEYWKMKYGEKENEKTIKE